MDITEDTIHAGKTEKLLIIKNIYKPDKAMSISEPVLKLPLAQEPNKVADLISEKP
jgi:hypothetical protein